MTGPRTYAWRTDHIDDVHHERYRWRPRRRVSDREIEPLAAFIERNDRGSRNEPITRADLHRT